MRDLADFVRESNRIEGIHREPTRTEMIAHEQFLASTSIAIRDINKFVAAVAGAPLRVRAGMNVLVGEHRPPPGGPSIKRELATLLARLTSALDEGRVYPSPWEIHCQYEVGHFYMDGNGRSGRVLWAWHHIRLGNDPFSLPFLHRFYYETLSHGR